jgi:hypothetical protein
MRLLKYGITKVNNIDNIPKIVLPVIIGYNNSTNYV